MASWRPVRVALCAPYDVDLIAGVSEFVRELRRALQAAGDSVEVFTPDMFEELSRMPNGFRNALLSVRTFVAILRSPAPWSAVHVNQPHAQAVAALLAARIRGVNGVATIHSPFPPGRSGLHALMQRIHHRLVMRLADVVVFVAAALRRDLGRPDDRVIYIAPSEWYLSAAPRTRPLDPGGVTILFVGRQTRSKGFFDLMDVIETLSAGPLRDRFRLRLVGQSTPEETAEKEARLRRLGNRVEDTGPVKEHAQLLSVYQSSDVIVLPSYREGLPLVLVEAMAVGCVPVATAIDGIPELVAPGVSGWLVPPGDRAALLAALESAIGRPEELGRRSVRAAETVRARFRSERTADRYRSLYARVEGSLRSGETGLAEQG